MTSSGYRFPARMQTGLAILIFTAASVLPPACARAESVFGRRYPSSRIYALGSRFAGITDNQLRLQEPIRSVAPVSGRL